MNSNAQRIQFASRPIVDVIIPTRGRGPLINVTIESILKSRCQEFILWVIDQSDDDATQQAVAIHAAQDSRVRYIHTKSRGSNIARNIGVAAGNASYLVFTDDDCRVEPNWLDCLINELAENDTWAVFGRIIPDEQYLETIPKDAIQASKSLPMALKDEPEREVYQNNRFNLGFGHGANMAFRRDSYEKLNGFDELLGAGGPLRSWPERDFGYRILAANGRIVYTPDAVVYHRHWRGWIDVRRTHINYAIGAGAAVIKYLRCGDMGGFYLLGEWFLEQGIRQILSGIIKWRSWQKINIGILHLIYPWVGIIKGWRYPVNHKMMVYKR